MSTTGWTTGGRCDGVFEIESGGVYVFSDIVRWTLGWILNVVIAHVEREVGDFMEGSGLDRFNFWLVGVWYVWDPKNRHRLGRDTCRYCRYRVW